MSKIKKYYTTLKNKKLIQNFFFIFKKIKSFFLPLGTSFSHFFKKFFRQTMPQIRFFLQKCQSVCQIVFQFFTHYFSSYQKNSIKKLRFLVSFLISYFILFLKKIFPLRIRFSLVSLIQWFTKKFLPFLQFSRFFVHFFCFLVRRWYSILSFLRAFLLLKTLMRFFRIIRKIERFVLFLKLKTKILLFFLYRRIIIFYQKKIRSLSPILRKIIAFLSLAKKFVPLPFLLGKNTLLLLFLLLSMIFFPTLPLFYFWEQRLYFLRFFSEKFILFFLSFFTSFLWNFLRKILSLLLLFKRGLILSRRALSFIVGTAKKTLPFLIFCKHLFVFFLLFLFSFLRKLGRKVVVFPPLIRKALAFFSHRLYFLFLWVQRLTKLLIFCKKQITFFFSFFVSFLSSLFRKILSFPLIVKKNIVLFRRSFSFLFLWIKRTHRFLIFSKNQIFFYVTLSFSFVKSLLKKLSSFPFLMRKTLSYTQRFLSFLFTLLLFLKNLFSFFFFSLKKWYSRLFNRILKTIRIIKNPLFFLLSLKNHLLRYKEKLTSLSLRGLYCKLFKISDILLCFISWRIKKDEKEKVQFQTRSLKISEYFIYFLMRLVFTNWLKRGYQFSIFMILSITVYSFTGNPLIIKEKPNIQKEITVSFQISDPSLLPLAEEMFYNFKKVSFYEKADLVIEDKYKSGGETLFLDAVVLCTHKNNPILSLTRKQVEEILEGKIKNWKALGWKDVPIQILKDEESYFSFAAKEEKKENIQKKLEQEENTLAFLALKNIQLSNKILMIDYHYPSKSEILLQRYPLSRGLYLYVNDKEIDSSAFANKNPFFSLIAGGDIMWSRGVDKKIREKGIDFLIEDLKLIFETGDWNVANLENPISYRGEKYNLDKGIFFRGNPEYMGILTKLKINLVSLANNHIFDYGLTAALDTLNYLKEKNIIHTGFGLDREEAVRGVEVSLMPNKKFRFLAYNTVYPINVEAKVNFPGIGMLNETTYKTEIEKAKKGVDYLVILMHSGEEYIFYPEESKKQTYRKMIDYGADMIIGSHPHVVQSVEIYKGKPIFYSLGNLLFDQYRLVETREQLVVEMLFYKGNLVAYFPHFYRANEDFKPILLKNNEIEFLLRRLSQLISPEPITPKKRQDDEY